MAIQQDQVMPLLLQACPSFTEACEEHRRYWDNDERLLYVDLGELARHVVQFTHRDAVGELAAVFEVVDRLILEGDDFVQTAIIVGLLEDIQTLAGHAGVDLNAFESYMKPETAYWWQRTRDFWDRNIPYIFDDRSGNKSLSE